MSISLNQILFKRTKICSIYEKIFFQKINKTSVSRVHFISTFRLHLDYTVYIVKYCHSFIFTDSIAFTVSKIPRLHLVSLFCKNCSYPKWAVYLCFPSNLFWFLVTERAFLVQKTIINPHSKNKIRNSENVKLMTTFHYFYLRTSGQVMIKTYESTKIKLLNNRRSQGKCFIILCSSHAVATKKKNSQKILAMALTCKSIRNCSILITLQKIAYLLIKHILATF